MEIPTLEGACREVVETYRTYEDEKAGRITEMCWVTQPGWILTFNDYEEHTILAVLVDNFRKNEAVARLKGMCYEHRHPRKGKTQLKWTLDEAGWKADGYYGGSFYLIEPFTVEVLS